jgi:ferritin
MLTKVILDALNDQIKQELYSAYLYLSMSTHCEAENLGGFAHWLRAQAQEELGHAMKIRAYIEDRGGRVLLQAIDQPPAEFEAPVGLFKQILEHEKKISGCIHRLYELAVKENDYPTQVMLQWFITEQVEEEKTASTLLEQLRMIGGSTGQLMMIDRYLARRGQG